MFFICVLYSCSTLNNTVDNKANNKLLVIANEQFGKDFVVQYNSYKTYALCKRISNDSNKNPNSLCEFFVLNLQTNKIEYQDKISSCKVSWESANELRLVKQLGIINSPQENGQVISIYNLKTKMKTKLTTAVR